MTNEKNRLAVYKETNSIHYYKNDNSEHLFVYNNSAKNSASGRLMQILISGKGNSNSVHLIIPATKLPVDLTEYANKGDILNCSGFMNALATKQLLICPEAEAFEKLESPQAKIEKDRLAKTKESLDISKLYNRNEISVAGDINEDQSISSSNELENIDLKIVETVGSPDYSSDEKLAIIQDSEDNLKNADWQYILDNSTDESIKEYAMLKLS